MKSKKRENKQKAGRKLSCSSLPFSAEEFAEYLELYDFGNECDAFLSLEDEEHEKALATASELADDLDDAFEKAKNAKVKTFAELMVHLDLSLSKWCFPSDFIIGVIKSLDNPILLSGLLLASMKMVEDLISYGLVDSQIIERGLFDFLTEVSEYLHDPDEINDSAAVMRVVSAWKERERLV